MENVYISGIAACSLIAGLCAYEFGKLLAMYIREREDKKPKLRIVEGGFVVGRMK